MDGCRGAATIYNTLTSNHSYQESVQPENGGGAPYDTGKKTLGRLIELVSWPPLASMSL